MRIGPVETSISALVHLAILVVCLIALPCLYIAKWSTVREAWCARPVNDALARFNGDKDGTLEKGIGYARVLVSAAPKRALARMSLACLLARAQQYKEAREVFEQAAALPTITPEEKSQALTGAACTAALDGGVEASLPKNTAEVEKLLISALAAKQSPDALAAMALLESWRPDTTDALLANRVDKALSAGAAAPGLMEELYFLQGVLAVRKHALAEASAAFERVRAVNPENSRIDDFQNQVLLAGLTDPSMPPKERRDLLTQTTNNLGKMSKHRNDAYFSMGLAWLALNGQLPDSTIDPLAKAQEAFLAVSSANPKDRRAIEAQIKIHEMTFAELLKDVKVPIPGLTGEQSEPGEWKKQYTSTSAITPEKTKAGVVLRKIETELYQIDSLWKDYLEKAKPANEERVEVLIRRNALRRQAAWLSPRDARKDRLKDANDLALEISSLDHSGIGEYLQGLIAIDLDEYAKASKFFQAAQKAGFKAPEMDKLVAALSRPPAYKDFGPRPSERSFGPDPLVRAILDSPLLVGGIHGQTLNLKGKPVKATVVSSAQLYYLPTSAELTGGANTFRAEALDAAEQKLEFPQFQLSLDRDPPTWSITPPPGPATTAQVWTITLADDTGIDWHTLRAGVRAAKGVSEIVVIRDGRYTRAAPAAGIKAGDAVQQSPITLTTGSPLTPATYQVFIEVSDTVGNKLKDQKIYSVK